MMRVSVTDLGTFSAILLIAEVRDGKLVPLCEHRQTVDLAYERGRIISRAAILRAARVIRKFDRLSTGYRADAGLIVGTAALRQASNRFAVIRELREVAPYAIRVLTDKQEAQFAARGALIGLRRTPKDPLVVDIGGGSTEFIRPQTNAFRGLPIGASWTTKAWNENRPRDSAKRDLYFLACAERAVLELDTRLFSGVGELVGTGGTITTLAAINRKLKTFDIPRLHGHILKSDWISAMAAQLSVMSERSIRPLIPFDPSRASVLAAGTYLWAAVLNCLNADRVTVSTRGLRWGVAAHLAGLP
jgi:exopolyphosphatase/guanosine-5'-triphosphate,3'-diphosphate pyrophosphatase